VTRLAERSGRGLSDVADTGTHEAHAGAQLTLIHDRYSGQTQRRIGLA